MAEFTGMLAAKILSKREEKGGKFEIPGHPTYFVSVTFLDVLELVILEYST